MTADAIDSIPANPAIGPNCQTLADLRALIPAGASPDALRAGAALLYADAPIAPERLVPILAFALLEGFDEDPELDLEAGWIWTCHAAAICALSPEPRAALCAAFRLRIDLEKYEAVDSEPIMVAEVAEVDVTDADCISAPIEDVFAALLPIAQDLNAEDIAEIAAADRGYKTAEHIRVITEQVRTGLCKDEVYDGWECLELMCHPPGGGRIWAACTAWIVIRAQVPGDGLNYAQICWDHNADVFLVMPPPLRAAFLIGFRGYMERDPDGWFLDAISHPIGFDASPPIPYEGPMF